MKHSLTYLFLLSIIGLTGAAAAETAGASVTAPLAYGLPFGLFLVSALLLILGTDYDRSYLPLGRREAQPLLLPANEAFAAIGADSTATLLRPIVRRRARSLALANG
jgi:hypothetical protein